MKLLDPNGPEERRKWRKPEIYSMEAPITAATTPVAIPNHNFWDPATNAGTAALVPETEADLAEPVAEPELLAEVLLAPVLGVVDAGVLLGVVDAGVLPEAPGVELTAAVPPIGAVDWPSICD